MEQQTPILPKSRMKPHEQQKRAIFPSLIWGGGGGQGFPFILSKIAILDKIKWNSKPPSPPNQGRSRAKGKNAPFFHLWFGLEGGVKVFHLFCPRLQLVLFSPESWCFLRARLGKHQDSRENKLTVSLGIWHQMLWLDFILGLNFIFFCFRVW